MAHLTKPTQYNIEDSNLSLLGSDLEHRVREHSGTQEQAWEDAGSHPGLLVWRIEDFHVVPWPKARCGTFYSGDSYIVLHTYKKDPDNEALLHDLHFWLGETTSQDEAGTAAYKTVELDDFLHGQPVQYREVQGYESTRFVSYFSQFTCLQGGVASGFNHVEEEAPLDIRKLYQISISRCKSGGKSSLVVREVPAQGNSLVKGDVFVLDKGSQVWQFNTKSSVGQEKFKAASFVQTLLDNRKGQSELTVYDEGGSGAGVFLSEFSLTSVPHPEEARKSQRPELFRLSDASGKITFESVEPTRGSLHSSDAFLLDDSGNLSDPSVFVWIGIGASLAEKRLAGQYAQRYLHNGKKHAQTSVVTVREGRESEEFLEAFGS